MDNIPKNIVQPKSDLNLTIYKGQGEAIHEELLLIENPLHRIFVSIFIYIHQNQDFLSYC